MNVRLLLLPGACALLLGACSNTAAPTVDVKDKIATAPPEVASAASAPKETTASIPSEAASAPGEVASVPRTSPPEVASDPLQAEKLTSNARFLAGQPVPATSSLASLQKSGAWQSHRRTFDQVWKQLEARQMSKVRQWAAKELATVRRSSESLFYPFSGPDYLYAHAFFPQATTCVMAGLEPVGPIPNFDGNSPAQAAGKLASLRSSLSAVTRYSFFKTNDMRGDYQSSGVLPVLYVFLSRTGHDLQAVQYVTLAKDGSVQPLDGKQFKALPRGSVRGVQIDFTQQNDPQPRKLYYFSTDLSDRALPRTKEFSTFVEQLPTPTTYLKAASYLLQYGNFSTIRRLVLAQSDFLLQDDSAPVRAFDRKQWSLQFYGSYYGTIPLFKEEYQPALRQIFRTDKTVRPLPFPIGYGFGIRSSNLMLAVKKKPQTQ